MSATSTSDFNEELKNRNDTITAISTAFGTIIKNLQNFLENCELIYLQKMLETDQSINIDINDYVKKEKYLSNNKKLLSTYSTFISDIRSEYLMTSSNLDRVSQEKERMNAASRSTIEEWRDGSIKDIKTYINGSKQVARVETLNKTLLKEINKLNLYINQYSIFNTNLAKSIISYPSPSAPPMISITNLINTTQTMFGLGNSHLAQLRAKVEGEIIKAQKKLLSTKLESNQANTKTMQPLNFQDTDDTQKILDDVLKSQKTSIDNAPFFQTPQTDMEVDNFQLPIEPQKQRSYKFKRNTAFMKPLMRKSYKTNKHFLQKSDTILTTDNDKVTVTETLADDAVDQLYKSKNIFYLVTKSKFIICFYAYPEQPTIAAGLVMLSMPHQTPSKSLGNYVTYLFSQENLTVDRNHFEKKLVRFDLITKPDISAKAKVVLEPFSNLSTKINIDFVSYFFFAHQIMSISGIPFMKWFCDSSKNEVSLSSETVNIGQNEDSLEVFYTFKDNILELRIISSMGSAELTMNTDNLVTGIVYLLELLKIKAEESTFWQILHTLKKLDFSYSGTMPKWEE